MQPLVTLTPFFAACGWWAVGSSAQPMAPLLEEDRMTCDGLTCERGLLQKRATKQLSGQVVEQYHTIDAEQENTNKQWQENDFEETGERARMEKEQATGKKLGMNASAELETYKGRDVYCGKNRRIHCECRPSNQAEYSGYYKVWGCDGDWYQCGQDCAKKNFQTWNLPRAKQEVGQAFWLGWFWSFLEQKTPLLGGHCN